MVGGVKKIRDHRTRSWQNGSKIQGIQDWRAKVMPNTPWKIVTKTKEPVTVVPVGNRTFDYWVQNGDVLAKRSACQ